MARMYIISGCNGAGKTTATYTMLPDMLNVDEYVNADEIAERLSPENPEKEALRASRLMMDRVKELIDKNEDFGIETTLATRSFAKTIVEAQRKGYMVIVVFFWLRSPELAIKRVAMRVAAGGHDIERETIVRRYAQGLENLRNIYIPVCNYWLIIDNSDSKRLKVAEGGLSYPIRIYNEKIYNKIMKLSNYEN
ncbi:MAG: zeta toxin family protein [Bacteroidales bacterium]|nr:zeta toxin family protein [Candidatus Cacconaster scatequi]